jgi:hypothetical protein
MATKVDAAVAKQRQQKIILVVGALLLVGILAFQLPRMMKSKKATTATAAQTQSGASATGTDTTATTTTPNIAAGATGPATRVAGVVVRSAGAPKAQTGQLWSLSRFKVKDPFVQQVDDKIVADSGSTKPDATGAAPGTTDSGTVTPTTSTPAALAYATLMVNGRAQQLTLLDVFPKGQPTFILKAVAKKYVMLGVAGGKFVGGQAVKLELGKRVTLMNTATGQRFVIKPVYVGSQPEHIATFKVPAAAVAASQAAKPAAAQPTQPATTQTTTPNP